MKAKSKTGSFAAFLDEMNRSQATSQQAPSAAPSTGDGALKLLTLLIEGGPQPVPALQRASGMDFMEFAETFRAFQQRGWVAVVGDGDRGQAMLTSEGKAVADMFLPGDSAAT